MNSNRRRVAASVLVAVACASAGAGHASAGGPVDRGGRSGGLTTGEGPAVQPWYVPCFNSEWCVDVMMNFCAITNGDVDVHYHWDDDGEPVIDGVSCSYEKPVPVA